MLTSFDTEESEPLIPEAPHAWSEGIGLAPGVVAAAFSDDDGYRLVIQRRGQATHTLDLGSEPVGIGREWENEWNGLSADGSLLCLREATDGNIQRCKLRVITTTSGGTLGEIADDESHLRLSAWSPIPGDQRIAVLHEKGDLARPAIWNLSSGMRTDLQLDLPGEAEVRGWWPDATALLLQHNHLGNSWLYRYEVDSGSLTSLPHGSGVITGAGVRPDGQVWLRIERPEFPPEIETMQGDVVLPRPMDAPRAATGRPFTHIETGAGADLIHTMLATPEGDGPFPTVLMIHGGPEWNYGYGWEPLVQAFVEQGCAVAMPNYRGSTGQGRRWREGFFGDVGFAESRDIIAALDDLIDRGITDGSRVVVEGWSWGGYLSLLLAGTRPDRFVGAIGGIPVADYVACHEDCSPVQQAYDFAVFGGGPDELPEMYAERSPITYVANIASPVLLIAGEADSRCPIRQVRAYVASLEALGKDVHLVTYGTGHHAAAVDEAIAHAEHELAFTSRAFGLASIS